MELLESEGTHWLTGGWSLDAIATPARGGLGIAKDLSRRRSLEVDIGGYVTQEYDALSRGEFGPALGIGLNVRF